MIEMIPLPQYKRTNSDGVKRCPYCGKQFNSTGDLFLASCKRPPFDLNPKKCSGCGKDFLYVNISKGFAKETGLSATYPLEYLKGIR